MARTAFNREFALVAACCRSLRDPARAAAVRESARPDLDWQHLLRVAQRHRVEPLVLDGLRIAGVDLPPEALSLAERVSAGAGERLAYVAETLRLAAHFEEAGIAMLCFKGAPLEQLAYARTGLKQSRDIDLLVDPDDLDRAHGLLAELGYACEYPDDFPRLQKDPAWRHALMREEKETVWRRGRLIVEVHWRLVHSHVLFPHVGAHGPRQSVELARGRPIATLALPELYAYLAIHGAHHGWYRLKWLADLVALVADLPKDDLVRLHDRAVSLRVGRCSAQALLLGEAFLGLELPAAFAARLSADRTVRSMVEFGAAVLSAQVPVGRVHEQPRFGGRLLRLHWQSSEDWSYRLELAARCPGMIADRARGQLRRWAGFRPGAPKPRSHGLVK
jgi:hypothetical protein